MIPSPFMSGLHGIPACLVMICSKLDYGMFDSMRATHLHHSHTAKKPHQYAMMV